MCVRGHCISHQLMGTICTPRNTTCQGFPFPKIAFLHVEREEAAPAAPWAAMRQNHPSLGPVARPYLPHCVPPPRPARSLPCSAGSWTVHPPGRSGQTGIKGKASLRGLGKPHCPPRQHHKGKKDTTLARTMSPGRKLLYTSTCTGESRQNHTACWGGHQRQDKCPPTAEGGGSCSSTVTGSASLTLSFSVARISSLLKKETEGSERQ